MSFESSEHKKKCGTLTQYEPSNSSDSDHENELCRMKIHFNGQRVRKTSFRLPCPDVARRQIRAHFANLRDQVRAEDRQLQRSAEEEDHKVSKLVAGGWALAPEQMHYLKTHDYEYNASAGSVLELLIMQRQALPRFILIRFNVLLFKALDLSSQICARTHRAVHHNCHWLSHQSRDMFVDDNRLAGCQIRGSQLVLGSLCSRCVSLSNL